MTSCTLLRQAQFLALTTGCISPRVMLVGCLVSVAYFPALGTFFMTYLRVMFGTMHYMRRSDWLCRYPIFSFTVVRKPLLIVVIDVTGSFWSSAHYTCSSKVFG